MLPKMITPFDYKKVKKPPQKIIFEVEIQKFKGPKGDQGIPGIEGKQGEQGIPGNNGKDGKNGRNGNDGKDGKNGANGKDGSPDTAEQVRDKLESLIKGKKLSIEAIEGLAKILEELSKNNKVVSGSKPVGSGISAKKSLQFLFIDDETPSGTINGVNTDFIIKRTPVLGSLKVYRGGARQRITEDYTLAHKTISFINAPQVGEIILCDYRVS
jgi:hypothetical protein